MASARPRRALLRRADFCVVWPLLHFKTLYAEALDNAASLGGSLLVAREQCGAFADLRRPVDGYKALVLCAAPRTTRFVKLERFGALWSAQCWFGLSWLLYVQRGQICREGSRLLGVGRPRTAVQVLSGGSIEGRRG